MRSWSPALETAFVAAFEGAALIAEADAIGLNVKWTRVPERATCYA